MIIINFQMIEYFFVVVVEYFVITAMIMDEHQLIDLIRVDETLVDSIHSARSIHLIFSHPLKWP